MSNADNNNNAELTLELIVKTLEYFLLSALLIVFLGCFAYIPVIWAEQGHEVFNYTLSGLFSSLLLVACYFSVTLYLEDVKEIVKLYRED